LTPTIDQVIQKVVSQTTLHRAEVFDRINQLERSFHPRADYLRDPNDPTFARLLAQELNIDVDDPTDYLYAELVFDQAPLLVRIIPLTTVNKTKIKATLRNLASELEPQIRKRSDLPEDRTISVREELLFLCGGGGPPDEGQLFVRDGILFQFESYVTNYDGELERGVREDMEEDFTSLAELTLEKIIEQAELYRTFTDYRIVQKDGKNFIPYLVYDKIAVHPPDWASFNPENFEGYLQFPYITLESLQPNLEREILSFRSTWTKEIIGTSSLQHCPNLKVFLIDDQCKVLEKIQFPHSIVLPRLEEFIIVGTNLQIDVLDLSFLHHSPQLQVIGLDVRSAALQKLILPSWEKHEFFQDLVVDIPNLTTVVFPTPWRCPNLRSLHFKVSPIKIVGLANLRYCTGLQQLILHEGRLKDFNLIPLKHCSDLRVLDLSRNQLRSIDLSPLNRCLDLQRIILSGNLLGEIDLTPLENHPALEYVHLENNDLDHIDLTPLVSCTNLKSVHLKGNSIPNLPSQTLHRRDLSNLRN
jgi:Leucine-rich repeat (LRR) protein